MESSETKIALIEQDIAQIKKDVSAIKGQLENGLLRYLVIVSNDVDWLKRFFWLLAGIAITSIASSIFGIIWRR